MAAKVSDIPIWVRVPVIVALVLAAVVISTAVLGSAGGEDGHGTGGDGGHDSGGGMQMDPNGGQGGHESANRNRGGDHEEGHDQ